MPYPGHGVAVKSSSLFAPSSGGARQCVSTAALSPHCALATIDTRDASVYAEVSPVSSGIAR